MKSLKAFIGAAMLVMAAPGMAVAAEQEEAPAGPGLYVIYDSSNSMWGELDDGSRKYEAARQAMSEFLDSDFGDQALALRIYGAQRADDCTDSSLVVPFQSAGGAAPLINTAVTSSRPTGRTPIHLSLLQALEDFGDRPGRILLISDGIESCGADPCALLQEWRDRDIDIDVHVVGFGLRSEERPALVCMADAAGTSFVEAGSAAELATALDIVRETEPGGEIADVSVPIDIQSYSRPILRLNLLNAEGENLTGAGQATLVDDDGTPIEYAEVLEVTTHSRNAILPGRVQVTAGVRTRNGEIYLPNSTTIVVAPNGETTTSLQVPEPPQVSVLLRQDGEVLRPSGMAEALIEGEVVFEFRVQDTIYVDPGDYVFRTSPNDFNQNMTEEITVPDNGTTEVVFDLAPTIRTRVRLFAAPWGERLSGPTRYYSDGVEVAGANASNAVRLAPGTYDFAVSERFATLEGQIEVTSETGDTIDIDIPAARVVVHYQTVSGEPDEDKRVFITPAHDNDGRVRQSGEVFYLVAGTYTLDGWRGSYETQEFEVQGGEDLTFVLRATE